MLERLRNAFKMLSRGEEIEKALKEVQRALIAADVDVALVLELTKRVKERVEKLPPTVSKKDIVIKELYKELVDLLGGKAKEFPIVPQRIMLVGLYGAGKTTTAAKLGYFLKNKGLDVMLVCADVHRPAAYDQLRQLAKQTGIRFYGEKGQNAVEIVKNALKEKADVYIIDTAGRSSLDKELIEELKELKLEAIPEKTLLVISADTGQIAGKEAKKFAEEVGIDGVIITKMDGSGKGGGALSACAAAGVPVYFIGIGEKIKDFEKFDADRFLSNILGVPDIRKLAEEVGEVKLPEKFDINAFYQQIKTVREMGSFDRILGMLGVKDVPKDMLKIAEERFKKYDAIYKSMTEYERRNPECFNKSRIERIAKGSGTSEEDVRAFLRDYRRVEKMYRKIKGREKYFEKMLERGRFPVIR